MDKLLKKDIINWDINNWYNCISFWEKQIDLKNKGYNCLELGSRNGGLSLWLALNKNYVICSDIQNPEEFAKKTHSKHNCNSFIEYKSVNALNIPFENKFDIVLFKSILGGISRNQQNSLKLRTIEQIHKSLKKDGYLLFAENLEGSFIHQYFRKKFITWGSEWNYLKYSEISTLFSQFSELNFYSLGFLGLFGRNENQRNMLSYADKILDKFIPDKYKYILIGIARK